MVLPSEQHLVITAVGPDRVGLVEKITQFLLHEQCNIEDSKMAVFCGEFTIILLVSGDAASLDKVSRSFEPLTVQTGLAFSARGWPRKAAMESGLACRLKASCLDHPGVVHGFSTLLSSLRVNIESLETKTHAAPMSGTPIFQLEALLSVPPSVNLHELRRALDEIGRRENIDIEFWVLPTDRDLAQRGT